MTEKLFKNVEENLEWGTVQYFTYYDEKINDKELEKLVNHLLNQNEQLKSEIEKLSYANEDLLEEKRIWKQMSEEYTKLSDENERLKAQLYCPFDSICIQCKNEYLVQKGEHYVSKCKKGHGQCSKVDVIYCDDFEVKELQE